MIGFKERRSSLSIRVITPETRAILASNLEEIRRSIDMNRLPGVDVTLLAATKTVSSEVINYVTQKLGVTDIGENRVQELLEKYDALDLTNVNLHFIGKLQPNKVKYIIDKVSLIHSLDSLSLADEIDKRAKKAGKTMPCLIEVNIGKESSKSGILPEDFESFLCEVKKRDAIELRGLMTIGPIDANADELKDCFSRVFSLFRDFRKAAGPLSFTPVLSMGMSDSYPLALSCGSNCVRIGSAIFGERVY